MEWTPKLKSRVADLWKEGKTTSQISSELGVTRGAISGIIHRMGLENRPSPLRPTPAGQPLSYHAIYARKRKAKAKAARQAQVDVKPALQSLEAKRAARAAEIVLCGIKPKPPICGAISRAGNLDADRSKETAPRLTALQVQALPLSASRTCQFIAGSGRPWTMCGRPSVVSRSWCREHLIVCTTVVLSKDQCIVPPRPSPILTGWPA